MFPSHVIATLFWVRGYCGLGGGGGEEEGNKYHREKKGRMRGKKGRRRENPKGRLRGGGMRGRVEGV